MNNKKWIGILVVALGMSFTLGAASGQKITAELKNQGIVVKGNKVEKQVISYNETTYVPLREFSSLLQEKVDYKDGLIYLGEVAESEYGYNNPAPIGVEQVVTGSHYTVGEYKAKVSVTEVLRGEEALQKIKEKTTNFAALREGEEFLMAKIKVGMLSMEKPGSLNVSGSEFIICSGNNTDYILDVSTSVPQPALYSNLVVDSSTEGYIIVRVNKEDKAPKIAYRDKSGKASTIAHAPWFSLAK